MAGERSGTAAASPTPRSGTQTFMLGFLQLLGGTTMRTHAIIIDCLLAASPVAAQSVSEKTGINALVGASPSTADFVKEAATSDMFEIQSSKLAAERSDDATKTYAKQMIADHEKTTTEMKAMVQSGKVQATLPTDLDKTHQGKLDTLTGLQGDAFTRQYHSAQVKAH